MPIVLNNKVLDSYKEIGTYAQFDKALFDLNLVPSADKYRLCNGQVIDLGIYQNYRTPNLSGNTINLTASIVSGNATITLSLNDVIAVNVGDTVSGTGIAVGSVISAVNYSNGQVTLSKLNNVWNTTTNTLNPDNTCVTATNANASITIIGFTFDVSSDAINWDTFQGHRMRAINPSFGFTTSNGATDVMATTPGIGQWQNTSNDPNTGDAVSDTINNTPRISNKNKQRTRRIKWWVKVL